MAIAVQQVRPGSALVGRFAPLDIAVDRCKGCGLCVSVCPKGVLELDASTVNELGYHPVRLDRRRGMHELRALCAGLSRRGVRRLRATKAGLT